ncbi:MAG: hypothetical protein V9E94_01860 [Microthrixaceae bacterium]
MNSEDGERTYSIWWFVTVFVLIGGVGLLFVLRVGSDSPTIDVGPEATLPAPTTALTSTTVLSAEAAPGTDEAPGAATAQEGLPDGVSQVMTQGGATSYVLTVPDDAGPGSEASVAPMQVQVGSDGRTATLRILCGPSVDDVPVQVMVTEGDTTVTFVAISVGPRNGAPCSDAVVTRELTVELANPIGGRAVVVVPAGTSVPSLGGG